MRVSIEDEVYSLVTEVNVESMFDNGKGRMIRTTDIFLVRVGMLGNLAGARRRARFTRMTVRTIIAIIVKLRASQL